MGRFFCGWYYRCQSDHQALAIIASYHKAAEGNSSEIQIVTDTDAFHIPFPFSDFHKTGGCVKIADNCFGRDGIRLNIRTSNLVVTGSLQFGPLTEIQYDIMGPFRFLPFMQCRHSVYSMCHTVNGRITINGIPYSFQNATGYIEGDRGRSFPKEYLWTQCSFPDGGLMLSVADIPLGTFRFTGVIGIIYLHGKEYRLATYLGARAVKRQPEEIIIRQGVYTLIIRPEKISGHSLHAPVAGAMKRTIHEHPSCKVSYLFTKNGVPLLTLDAHNAALEYEY